MNLVRSSEALTSRSIVSDGHHDGSDDLNVVRMYVQFLTGSGLRGRKVFISVLILRLGNARQAASFDISACVVDLIGAVSSSTI